VLRPSKSLTLCSQTNLTQCRAELVCWVSESLWPFEIVKDWGFQSLMKIGWPEYYLPSPTTISHDVRLMFAHTQQCIAKMLRVSELMLNMCETDLTYQEYKGKISFTMDTWTSTNHRAFVAVSVHLEHNGVPLSLPLDIIEVAKVCWKTYEVPTHNDMMTWPVPYWCGTCCSICKDARRVWNIRQGTRCLIEKTYLLTCSTDT